MKAELSDKFKSSLAFKEPVVAFCLHKSRVEYAGLNTPARFIFQPDLVCQINPDYFCVLNEEQQIASLAHDCLHFLLGHNTLRHSDNPKMWKAQDLAVNSLLCQKYDLPPCFELPHKYNLADQQSAEYYFSQLPDDEYDTDHSGWVGNTGQIEALLTEFLTSRPNTALSDSAGINRQGLEIKIKPIEDQWFHHIKFFAYSAVSRKKTSNYKRYSRRWGLPFPARKVQRRPKATCIIDVSASMENHLPKVFGWLEQLARFAILDVYQCDVGVQEINLDFKPSSDYLVKGLGGTRLQPAFDQAYTDRAQYVICFTDGCLADERVNIYNIPTLWVLFDDIEFNHPGEKLHVV